MKKNKYIKKIISIYLAVIFGITSINLPISNFSLGYTLTEGINSFPDSYKEKLVALQQKHPNWAFTAFYTGLDWNTVIDNEDYVSSTGSIRSQVSSGGSWVRASKDQIKYRIDPRNYLDEVQIFQFENLLYNDRIQTRDGLERMLNSTAMKSSNGNISYLDSNGNRQTINKTYATVISDAGIASNISTYHLASRIIQENMGWNNPFEENESINGKYNHPEFFGSLNLKGLYNFFNIQATGNHPIGNGLLYAKDKNWSDPEKSIKGGAEFLKNDYIGVGQNTLYFQKFDVVSDSNGTYWHQYQQNLDAPYYEASRTYNTYSDDEDFFNNAPFNFIIPVYNNMTGDATTEPGFIADNTIVYLNDPIDSYPIADKFPIRVAPNDGATLVDGKTHDETSDNPSERTKFRRIGIGTNTEYDKLEYSDGRVGYVKKKWIYIYQEQPSISLNKDEYTILMGGIPLAISNIVNISYQPNSNYTVDISDNTVAEYIDGKVVPKKEGETTITVKLTGTILFDTAKLVVKKNESGKMININSGCKYAFNGETINKVDANTTVENFKNNITTDYTIEYIDSTGKTLNNSEIIGTGTTIRILDNSTEIFKYNVIIYGDVDGNGKINLLDALKIQKHYVGLEELKSSFLEAASVINRNQKVGLLDALRIQKQYVGLEDIVQ